MSLTETVIAGTLQPDGTLILDEKPNLPPGRVQVIVQVVPDLPKDDPFWQRMQAMWAIQQTRGHVPRSADEVEAERRRDREESMRRQEAIEQLQEEARRLRERLS